MKKTLILVTSFFFFTLGLSQDILPGTYLEGSYTSAFTLYDDRYESDVNKIETSQSVFYGFTNTGGSYFLISTHRPDNKVCALTAGHTLRNINVGETFLLNSYFSYKGQTNDPPSVNNSVRTISSKFKLIPAQLKSKKVADVGVNDEDQYDIALLLMDRSELPININLVGKGIELYGDDYDYDETYSIGHPLAGHQRIEDHIVSQFNPTNLFMDTSNAKYITHGESGSPVVKDNGLVNREAVAVISYIDNDYRNPTFKRFVEEAGGTVLPSDLHNENFMLSRSSIATKISVLRDEIINFCNSGLNDFQWQESIGISNPLDTSVPFYDNFIVVDSNPALDNITTHKSSNLDVTHASNLLFKNFNLTGFNKDSHDIVTRKARFENGFEVHGNNLVFSIHTHEHL